MATVASILMPPATTTAAASATTQVMATTTDTARAMTTFVIGALFVRETKDNNIYAND